MIAKLRVVARVVLFSSVGDKGHTTLAIPWIATHVTPAARYWGLAHDRVPALPPIRANWDSLGMDAFGAAVAPETSEPPCDFTHMLVTDLVPQGARLAATTPMAALPLTPIRRLGRTERPSCGTPGDIC